MNTRFFPRTSSLVMVSVTAVLMLNQASAQETTMNKKVVAEPELLLARTAVNKPGYKIVNARLNTINLHAMKDFMNRYKEVAGVLWYKIDGGFKAEFTSGEITTSVVYKENGTWLHTIKTFGEKDLAKDIRAIVKRSYYDFNITSVEEVQVPGKDDHIFIVHVQDTATIKLLRICDGELQVYKTINKS